MTIITLHHYENKKNLKNKHSKDLVHMKLEQAKQKFLIDRGTYCSLKSLHYYDYNISNFINWLSENEYEDTMEDLPFDVLDQYILYLRSRRDSKGNTILTNTSVSTYIRAVRVYLNYCCANGLCNVNLSVKLPRADNDLIVPLSVSEINRLDALFDFSDIRQLRNYCCIHLMLDAGLRLSEVANLTSHCLDLEGRVIYVKNSKYNKSRIVPLYGEYASRLETLKSYCRTSGSMIGLSLRGIQTMFRRISVPSNIPRLHPHLCRHTFATSYLVGGGNLERLRLMLGHCDYSTTMMYLHLSEQFSLTGYSIYRLHSDFFRSGY